MIQYPEINLEQASKKFTESDLSLFYDYQQNLQQYFCIEVNKKQRFCKKYLEELDKKHFLDKLEESKINALNYLANTRFQEKLAKYDINCEYNFENKLSQLEKYISYVKDNFSNIKAKLARII